MENNMYQRNSYLRFYFEDSYIEEKKKKHKKRKEKKISGSVYDYFFSDGDMCHVDIMKVLSSGYSVK